MAYDGTLQKLKFTSETHSETLNVQ